MVWLPLTRRAGVRLTSWHTWFGASDVTETDRERTETPLISALSEQSLLCIRIAKTGGIDAPRFALTLNFFPCLRWWKRVPRSQAAALRLAASRSSTSATVWSTTVLRMPYCAPVSCTSRSVRSILGAPLLRARAAEDGRTRSFAAAAYFSNGTKSFPDAPSLSHTPQTQL